MEGGPGPHVRVHLAGPAIAGQQRGTAPKRGQVENERGGSAHGGIERRRGCRQARIEEDKRRGIAPGDEAAFEQLPGPRHRRPMDPGGGASLAMGAQAVHLELDRARLEPRDARGTIESGERAQACLVPLPLDEDRFDPRQDEELAAIRALHVPLAEPERIGEQQRRGFEPPWPATA